MSTIIRRGSLPHFERGAPTILTMLSHNNPFFSVTNPMYHGIGGQSAPSRRIGQIGGGVAERHHDPSIGNVFSSSYGVQKGKGMGTVFKKIKEHFRPLLSRGVGALLEEGRRAGNDFISEMGDGGGGGDLVESGRRHLRAAGRRLGERLPRILTGRGKNKMARRVVERVRKRTTSSPRSTCLSGKGLRRVISQTGAGAKSKSRSRRKQVNRTILKVLGGGGKRKKGRRRRSAHGATAAAAKSRAKQLNKFRDIFS